MLFRRILRPDNTKPVTRRQTKAEVENNSSALPPSVFRQLDRLQIRGSRELRGERIGMRSSHRRKPSAEFLEHRAYVPGDDIRYVDWRASARHEHVFIRQGELPKEVIVYLLIDCSASMQWGRHPKSALQQSLAAVLGYLSLAHGDRVFVHPYGGSSNPDFGPVSGKGQFNNLLRYLRRLNYGGEASLGDGLRGLKQKISRGGIMFVLSDLLERGNLSAILSSVPVPLWWVNIIHLLHPQEIDPSLQGALELEDIETGVRANYDLTADAIRRYKRRIEEWQNKLELTCVENHASYTIINTESSIEKEVIPYLRSIQMLVDV